MTLLFQMRFVSSRLETRTKEFLKYASLRVEKTLEGVAKAKRIVKEMTGTGALSN